MSDKNRACQPGRVTLHPDVQPGPTTRQTTFSRRGDVPLSGHTVNKFRRPAVLQPNIEGFTASKINVLHHLAVQHEALVILFQETHCTCTDKLTISGFALAGSSLSRKHCLATFVHNGLKWTIVDQSPTTSETEWLCVDVNGYRIVNVYKPPSTRSQASDLSVFLHSILYAGYFNSSRLNWGYRTSSADAECLVAWASLGGLVPLHDTKDVATFNSGRWNTGTNPDLTFVSVGLDSRVPDRRILEKFSRSQHRPSLTVPPKIALPVPSKPVERWDFRKANWSYYNALTNKLAKSLLPPDSPDVDLVYQYFCNVIRRAIKNSIPRGRRNNHIPCWDAECENLYRTFLQSPEGNDSNRAATALLLRLDKKRRDRWSEAVQTVDFLHSSRKRRSILNNLTGRSRRPSCHCAISANAIASQLIRNGRYEGVDRESSRLISQEVSDLWRATPTSPVNTSESFTSQEFAAALKHLKPGKAPGQILFVRS